jgi:hypothetical protein
MHIRVSPETIGDQMKKMVMGRVIALINAINLQN